MSDRFNPERKLFTLPNEYLNRQQLEHAQQHNLWDRRSFFRTLGLGLGGAMMLGNMRVAAASLSPMSKALAASDADRVLVLIRLKGGNDGLNTIVPVYDYGTYASFRPTVKIQQSATFSLSSEFAMPNFMDSLQPLWGDGKMKVVHGVGYDEQNLSHFRSADIWATGTDQDEILGSGVMGRYYEEQFPDFLNAPPSQPLAIQVGSVGNLLFTGSDNTSYAFSVADPEQLYQLAQNGWLHSMTNLPECLYGEQLGFLRAITNNTLNYAGVINEAYTTAVNSVSYDNTYLSNQLAMVARLIKGGLGTKVYLVTLDGFDTHADQADLHQTLLTDMAHGVSSFFADLAAGGRENDVLCMTFSEFGRRVEQNASDGTDHGAAAPSMLFGPGLAGSGFVGEHPSLTDLDNAGNMQHHLDYRQLYASVLEHWLCIPAQTVDDALLGVEYERLDLGFNCVSSVEERDDLGLDHKALYLADGEVVISYDLPASMYVQIQIFDIMGRQVAVLDKGSKTSGNHQVAIRANSGHLSNGQYVYRIQANDRAYSRSVVLMR
ncbi:MAG: DUF1501 domain-containing protein [Flavobacteriales bacterium]|nr:DUF1501 domain-containing protein [Flavobacteriales bacterium]